MTESVCNGGKCSDDEVAEWEQHLRDSLSGQIRGLRLVVKARGIILRGHARTYYAKQLAQHFAMELTGLPILANEVEVR